MLFKLINRLLHPKSIQAKILAAGIFMIFFLGGFLYLTRSFTLNTMDDARRINLAGSERMRLFEMSYHMNGIAGNSREAAFHLKEIRLQRSDLIEILHALKHGSLKWGLHSIEISTEEPEVGQMLDKLTAELEREILPLIDDLLKAQKKGDRAQVVSVTNRYDHKVHNFVLAIDAFVNILQKDNENDIKVFNRDMYLFFIAAVMFSFLIFIYIRQSVLSPIAALSETVKKLGAGDFSARIKKVRNDEIGMLAAAFNTMSETIETELKEIKAAEAELKYLASFPEMNPNPVIEFNRDRAITYRNSIAGLLLKTLDFRDFLNVTDKIFADLEIEGHAYTESALGNTIYGAYIQLIPETGVYRTYLYDITMQKQAEKTLLEYNETLEVRIKERTKELEVSYLEASKYFNAIEQAAEAILITNTNGVIQYANPAVTNITGYDKIEILGRNPKIFNSGKNPPGMFTAMWKTIRSGEIWHGTVINKKKSGELYNEEMTVTPIKDLTGQVINFIAIKNDVTLRVRAEEELQRRNMELELARADAEAANRAKSEFLANMSHELKTPLNHIMGFSELIHDGLSGPITDKQREYSGDIMKSGSQLLLMINDMLELSKIEAGKVELQFNEFNIGKMLEGVLAAFRKEALKHNIKTSLDIGDLPEAVSADERKLKQIVGNLLSNAFKFTPDGGSVSVRARRGIRDLGLGDSKREPTPGPHTPTTDGNFIEISVADTGIGISEENQKRLFKAFGQMETTLTKKYQGTGLGLYLSKKLVEMHGGSIWVESREGEGSRFSFIVPIKKQEVPDE